MPDAFPATALAPDGFPKSGWTPPDTGVQLAPGGEADARARGLVPPAAPQPAPVVPAAPVQAAPAKPAPRFAPGLTVEEWVPWSFPIEYDGKIHNGVTVRRLTIGTLAAFMEARGDARAPGAVFRYPIYFDVEGAPMPDVVLDAVEMSDHVKVVKATERFLPPDLGPAGA